MQRAEKECSFSAVFLGQNMDELNEKIDNKALAASFLVGRLPIYTSIEGFDPARTEEIIPEVNEALTIHTQNNIAMNYLYWYRRGVTPIYAREKTVRDEINNKINVAHAGEIVDFKNGYFMTQPAFYVARRDDDDVSEKVAELNEYLYRSGKQVADNKMVDWFHTVGKANLFVQSNDDREKPFVAYALDPRSTFVVRSMSAGNEPVYAVHTVVRGDTLYLDVWDKQNVYTLKGTVTGKLTLPFPNYECTASELVDVKPNPLKKIPIIEYYYNSVCMGAFESVIPLLDAISALQSDRLDGVDQFIQSLLVFYNCQLGEDEQGNPITPQLIRAMGAVFLKSVGDAKADLKEISSQLDQSQTQVFIDNLYQQVLSICGMPYTAGSRGFSNASTGQAMLFRDGWYQADAMARNTEDLFIESNRQFDEIICDILREKGLLDIKTTDFTLQFVRNETANVQSKAQAFQTLLAAGMHPELAAAKSGISNDPVADMEMSEPYLKLIWGDPDDPLGLEYGLDGQREVGEVGDQANTDERLAQRRARTARYQNDTTVGKAEGSVNGYIQRRNGREVWINGYKRTTKGSDEQ